MLTEEEWGRDRGEGNEVIGALLWLTKADSHLPQGLAGPWFLVLT